MSYLVNDTLYLNTIVILMKENNKNFQPILSGIDLFVELSRHVSS